MVDSYIYVIAASEIGPVKIGLSKAPAKRKPALPSGRTDIIVPEAPAEAPAPE